MTVSALNLKAPVHQHCLASFCPIAASRTPSWACFRMGCRGWCLCRRRGNPGKRRALGRRRHGHRLPCEVLDSKALARARPLSRRSFYAPKDYCLRVPTAHQRLPLAGRFGAWLCNQIRRPPRKQDRPGSPGLGLQCVATKIGGGKTSPRVALTMVESCCSGPPH